MLRLDEILTVKGFVPSRSQAKLLISAGKVSVNGMLVRHAGKLFPSESKISVSQDQQFVGRGGEKLAHALKEFKISVQNLTVADIGACTGGFTDCLLRGGARKVYALDVGHGQMSPKLLLDFRVVNLEGVNIKNTPNLPEKIELATVDLSHISLKKVLKNVFHLLKKDAPAICLFKPQFENNEPKMPGKKGVMKTEKSEEILQNFKTWLASENYQLLQNIVSPLKGKSGNTEYLLLIKKISE